MYILFSNVTSGRLEAGNRIGHVYARYLRIRGYDVELVESSADVLPLNEAVRGVVQVLEHVRQLGSSMMLFIQINIGRQEPKKKKQCKVSKEKRRKG